MSDESDGDSESSSKNAKKSGFKCCVKKNCSVCVCINCFSIYHNSCVKKMGRIKKVIDDTKIECCTPAKVAGNGEIIEVYKVEQSKLNMEIQYLKQLLEELNDKNNILKQNNGLLVERINQMYVNTKPIHRDEGDKKLQDNNRQKPATQASVFTIQGVDDAATNITVCPTSQTEKSNQVLDTATNTTSDKDNSNYAGVVKRTNIDSSNRNHRNGNGIADYGNNNKYTFRRIESGPGRNETPISNGDFEVPKQRRYRKRLGRGDTTENESAFAGEERRLWLYINRVKRSAEADTIFNFIKKKVGFENDDILVKEIPSNPEYLKRFVVIGPLGKRNQLYDPTFWPKNIGIKRFNFERHKNFLANEIFFK